MLDATSSRTAHILQNAALLLLHIVTLPFTLTTVLCSLAIGKLLRLRNGARTIKLPPSQQKTVLVTGVGMTKGLTLARSFHKAGHRVIGADFEPNEAFSPGRFSNSLARFYRLQKPSSHHGSGKYIQGLLDIIRKENVDLWVSCSGVASAVEDGEAKEIIENRTECKAIQFDVKTTQTLHEKHTFIQQVQGFGLNSPETHTITSHGEVQDALRNAAFGQKYIMKPIGMDDSARGDMTLLPKATWEETLKHINGLKISKKNPWILQQFVRGAEFCTHSLVINGKVKVFVSCPSSELLMHYGALPVTSPLHVAMRRFTERFAQAYGHGFTGHLSFDFLVEDTTPKEAEKIRLYPIECNPRAHTAVVLFSDTSEMVPAYLSLLDKEVDPGEIVTPLRPKNYYWIGHDLVEKCFVPFWHLLLMRMSFKEHRQHTETLASHLATWKDGTFTFDDPLPLLALYHLYWPVQFLSCIRYGTKWSRLNVSTLKMFEC